MTFMVLWILSFQITPSSAKPNQMKDMPTHAIQVCPWHYSVLYLVVIKAVERTL